MNNIFSITFLILNQLVVVRYYLCAIIEQKACKGMLYNRLLHSTIWKLCSLSLKMKENCSVRYASLALSEKILRSEKVHKISAFFQKIGFAPSVRGVLRKTDCKPAFLSAIFIFVAKQTRVCNGKMFGHLTISQQRPFWIGYGILFAPGKRSTFGSTRKKSPFSSKSGI